MHVECYHYETRVQRYTTTDSKGRSRTRTKRVRTRVNTWAAAAPYHYCAARDVSGDAYRRAGFARAKLLKLTCTKAFTFADEASAAHYEWQRRAFIAFNRRDVHFDFRVE